MHWPIKLCVCPVFVLFFVLFFEVTIWGTLTVALQHHIITGDLVA